MGTGPCAAGTVPAHPAGATGRVWPYGTLAPAKTARSGRVHALAHACAGARRRLHRRSLRPPPTSAWHGGTV